MANTKISALTALTTPTGGEEFVYAYNNANGKITLNTMKSFVGGAGITTLSADANIWELSEGTYLTEYDLYYVSGQAVPTETGGEGRVKKQMLFVTEDGNGAKGFFTFSAGGSVSSVISRASYGYSKSSADGVCNLLGARDYVLDNAYVSTISIDSIQGDELSQIISDISGGGTQSLRISPDRPPHPGITYTICVTSVASTYSITLGTGVTNPLGIALPTNSNKGCVITVLTTSSSTGIVTSCQMMQ